MTITEQELFWAGDFGAEYTERNAGAALLASRTAMLAKMLSRCATVSSVLELGANRGLNLVALHTLLPNASLAGVEINKEAHWELSAVPYVTAHRRSLIGYRQTPVDFVFTSGVLIHVAPEALSEAYATLYECSARYVAIAEYYNPAPVEIPYRGHAGKLFKRDFAAELMQSYPLRLVDYGFVYHRDPCFPADDLTWFVMEKITP
jgi:pseudaminic acid biosynthesis-associated methylase